MLFNPIEIILCSLPFGIGMIFAFLASKKNTKLEEPFTVSDNVWYGYAVGSVACIFSAGIIVFILFLYERPADWSEIIAMSLAIMVLMSIASFILGLFLYIPCALMGANLAARKRAEQSQVKTQQEIIAKIDDK